MSKDLQNVFKRLCLQLNNTLPKHTSVHFEEKRYGDETLKYGTIVFKKSELMYIRYNAKGIWLLNTPEDRLRVLLGRQDQFISWSSKNIVESIQKMIAESLSHKSF